MADATRVGSTVGVIAGAASGRPLRGLGGAAGAAAGLAGVLLTRGPDALLHRGTQLDMVFDRDLVFTEQEVTFQDPLGRSPIIPERSQPSADQDGRQQGGAFSGFQRSSPHFSPAWQAMQGSGRLAGIADSPDRANL